MTNQIDRRLARGSSQVLQPRFHVALRSAAQLVQTLFGVDIEHKITAATLVHRQRIGIDAARAMVRGDV
jgi:hypothetical protein